MTASLVWTRIAKTQLAELHAYIAESNISAADNQVAIVLHAVSGLANFPQLGRPGRRRGTRELVISGTPYIVAYRSKKSALDILAVIHGARRWPKRFDL
jgi:toxin ParE1/3/4